ncbi:general transcription factor IIF subunit 1 isoform X1 [Chiloscyllium plagiosum]|uniref:general transcription factor IIF subunit 1 isoform X1 n=1 Tax=Chiloscyllium plagiosum TaxID=36176 RepID=UPI001CB889B1|nr:general transcription factor IIF subunit 1 isoform X1 [Chiloscyllium plagiosum]XP_043550997.1 general transcription factor IIF subunit 1 isoform X1 [Chiloscyllium plagiosum]XP_043550998.1 general transcription factor IIF subunit 1 isoform X1 [Chiloscyllium plagiosum]XP_043550999.1 general transcription factor IIF subunit 1 isoform X1 [Chiloscyllium plagiosum]
MANLGSSSQAVTEYTVRVPKNNTKKHNIMAFNAADKIDFSTWTQAKMERDLSNKKIYQEEEQPMFGAGSEFGKKLREESRKKKFGIVTREFKPEDQPWLLRVNGKAGRKFKGQRKGGVTENASYYIFTQCPDGAFEAFPVNAWYNFIPVAKHKTLTAEEAEEEWGRRNKVVNHFSIMLQKRLKDQDRDDGEEEEEKGKKGKERKRKGNDLRIHDLEDDLEMSSDENDEDSDEDRDTKKFPKATKKGQAGAKRKKRKGSDDEAVEDSDDGDFEGQEVDYISDDESSDNNEDELEKGKADKGEDVPKGVDETVGSESSEESEEEKQNEEKDEEDDDKKSAAPDKREKKNKGDSSEESESSDESDIESEAASALFMSKKKTPPKKDWRGSNNSSCGNSRPGTPTPQISTSSTLKAAANKLEQGKRQGNSAETPVAKRLKMDTGPQTASGKSTPQPQSGKSTPSSGDIQLTEDAVRRYLTRKPMTTKDLLKKFQTKKTGLSSEQTVNVLAQILKKLNPERKMINEKMHFFLKEGN